MVHELALLYINLTAEAPKRMKSAQQQCMYTVLMTLYSDDCCQL